MNEIFKLQNVSYSYSKLKHAIDDISFSVYSGDSIALLGSNGSGKSTILKLMNALIFPQKGYIEAFGQPLTENSLNKKLCDFRKKTGLIFQDSDTQLFCSTVFEEIAFALYAEGKEEAYIREKTEEILKEFEIIHLKDEPPWMLSGGEKKKTALASVLVYSPDVILFDEPTNSLDPRSKKWLKMHIKKLAQSGKNIIISTNDLDVAQELTQTSIILNEMHQIEKIGKTTDLLTNKTLLEKANII